MINLATPSYKNLPLFNGMQDKEVDEILEMTEISHFEPGSTIIREGEQADSFFLVDEGKVKVCRRYHDEEKTLICLEAKTIFGEMALLSDLPRAATVYAETSVLARKVTSEEFQKMLDCGNKCVTRLIMNLAKRLAVKVNEYNQQFCLLDENWIKTPSQSVEQKSVILKSEIDTFRDQLFKDWNF